MVDSTEATAAPLTPTPATQWKSATQLAGVDLPLPSGNVARVRRMSPQAFLDKGLIPDPLSDIVNKAIHSKKGLPPEKVQEMAKDPKKIDASLELFDRVLSYVMIMPVVQMPPRCVHVVDVVNDVEVRCNEYYNVDDRHSDSRVDGYHAYTEGPRREDVLYCDQIDMTDKLYIFQFCLGATSDLTSFREQVSGALGGLPDQQDVQLPA